MALFIDKTYTNKDFTHSKLKGEFDNCTFIKCDFSEQHLSNLSFLECNFQECNFTNTYWGGTTLNDVQFDNCKMLGSDLSVCNPFMLKLRFRESILNLTTFTSLNLSNTSFDRCSLQEADFTDSTLVGASFISCDLKGATFKQSNLEKADFSTSFNYTIDPTQNRIKGAHFSKDQVAGLLRHFGIHVT